MGRNSVRWDWLAIWILGSAWANAAGWGLSALGHLDRAGYIASIVVFVAVVISLRRQLRSSSTRPAFLARKSTYARWLPRCWLALTLLVFIGGTLHAPDNFDYLTYRFPRLLHWWWDGHWSWLKTPEDRQNTSAVGMEWLMAPSLVLFHTDRLFFLINFISFLFLPGLVFTVFRQAGVAGRVAWSWMWLLPAGFCFVLQAASMGNDTFAAVYFLAALHYARKARGGSPLDVALSVLAIALVTGAKASNIPLVLPWLVMLWLQGRPLLAAMRPATLLATALFAILASFLPIAVANTHYTGSYTGDPTNHRRLQAANPIAGVLGNGAEIVGGNLAPPIWPHEFQWPYEKRMVQLLSNGYPRFGFTGVPFQIEETAAIGPGLVVLSAIGIIYGLRRRISRPRSKGAWLFAASIAVACLGYMAKMSNDGTPRLMAVYYVAGIFALLLVFPIEGSSIHRAGWRTVAVLCFLMAFPLVALNPARPVLPAPWIGHALRLVHAPKAAVDHLLEGYRLRAQRRDELHDLRQFIPSEEKVIGVMGSEDEPGASLWLPFGSRGTVEMFPDGPAPSALHLRYVAVSSDRLRDEKVQLDDLQKKWAMTIVARQSLQYTLRREPQTWYLLRGAE